MAIVLRLDRIMADRKISLTELSERVGISMANLSNLKTGKVKAIRFSTLDSFFMREFFILSENGAYSLNDAVPCFRNTAGPGKSYFRKDSINRK
jgi:putative transcriptional regulator